VAPNEKILEGLAKNSEYIVRLEVALEDKDKEIIKLEASEQWCLNRLAENDDDKQKLLEVEFELRTHTEGKKIIQKGKK